MSGICLVTQNCLHNFGSDLQACALFAKLRSHCGAVEVLNYWPGSFYEDYHGKYLKLSGGTMLKLKKLFSNAVVALHSRDVDLSRRRFAEFREENLRFTKEIYKTESDILRTPPEADVFVCGSDQAWSPYCLDPVRFLSFARKLKRGAVSYAPSLGVTAVPEDKKAAMKAYLAGVDCLSSRERVGADIVKSIDGRDCATVLDPTLLFDSAWWQGKFDKSPIVEGDYILSYVIHPNPQVRDLLLKVRRYYNMPLVLLFGGMSASVYYPSDNAVYSAGPKEFLNLIYNAKKLFLSSFHGIVFSILFHKDFYAVTSRRDDSRMSDILGRTGLSDRLITSFSDISGRADFPDFSRTDSLLAAERANSETYLSNSLSQWTN